MYMQKIDCRLEIQQKSFLVHQVSIRGLIHLFLWDHKRNWPVREEGFSYPAKEKEVGIKIIKKKNRRFIFKFLFPLRYKWIVVYKNNFIHPYD